MTNRTCQFLFAVVLLLCAVFSDAQVAPFQGLGNVQFFDNNGKPLTSGVLYSYQAGTSTQQATYTDSTGTILNPNPIPFGSGARVAVWLTSGAFYKFVLCAQNDGAFCAPGDVLFSVDQVPGSSSGSGGGGGGSPFISGSANPATTGILRLATGDTICYRNTANSSNLCWRKDTNDLLSWDGGSLKFPEVGAPTGVGSFDLLWADNSAHRWKMLNNGGSAVQVVGSGVDVNTSDQVNQLHFGATATPLSVTAPTTGQILQWNGTQLVPYTPEFVMGWCFPSSFCLPLQNFGESLQSLYGTETLFAGPHTLIRFTYNIGQTATGCTTGATLGVRDMSTSTNLITSTVSNGASVGFVDSGPLSVAMTAGDKIMVGVIIGAIGCSQFPTIHSVVMVYQ